MYENVRDARLGVRDTGLSDEQAAIDRVKAAC